MGTDSNQAPESGSVWQPPEQPQPAPPPPPPHGGPGHHPGQFGQPPVFHSPPGNGVGVAGFVTGLLGLIFFWIPLVGLALSILGTVMGGVGLSQGRKVPGTPTGLAIAGLVLGIVGLVFSGLVTIAVFA